MAYVRPRTHSHSSQNPPNLSPAYPYAAVEPDPYAYPSASPHYPSPGGFVVPQEKGFSISKDGDHKHSHRHTHHHHSSHKHSSSQNAHVPTVTVHAHGQTYNSGQQYSVARPSHKYSSSAHVLGAPPVQVMQQSYYGRPQVQMPMPHTPPVEPQYYGPDKKHFFHYSRCNGRRKALCIGINYIGQPHQLNGCMNDARRMRDFLIKRYGFLSGDIVLLTDDGKSSREKPTKQNIIDAMHWLVKDAHRDDSLVFHYSGHGGQTKDLDGDEEDGYDEVIYSVDFKKHGHIVDDEMHDIMVKPLPAGTRLTAIFDCCHSGSALDLPYMYGTGGKLKREPKLIGNEGFLPRDAPMGMNSLTRAFEGLAMRSAARGNQHVGKYAVHAKMSAADVISWSGCKDSQTSADTYEQGTATGAMSYAFMKSLKENPNQSYQQLLSNIRNILKSNFSQKPQLSSSHPIDTRLKFVL